MKFDKFGYIAICCTIMAGFCAVAIGVMAIGIHEGWWEHASVIPAVKPLTLIAVAFLAIGFPMTIVTAMRSRTR